MPEMAWGFKSPSSHQPNRLFFLNLSLDRLVGFRFRFRFCRFQGRFSKPFMPPDPLPVASINDLGRVSNVLSYTLWVLAVAEHDRDEGVPAVVEVPMPDF